ncbi:MAG: hypothetical protein ACI9HK_004000 [Pirellulaceae bacterium]
MAITPCRFPYDLACLKVPNDVGVDTIFLLFYGDIAVALFWVHNGISGGSMEGNGERTTKLAEKFWWKGVEFNVPKTKAADLDRRR